MTGKADYRKTKRVGGGGYNCECCGPKGGQEKKEFSRAERASAVSAETECTNALNEFDQDLDDDLAEVLHSCTNTITEEEKHATNTIR